MASDFIVDIGPNVGNLAGEVVFTGTLENETKQNSNCFYM